MAGVNTRFARVLVDELVRNGVTDACLAPGSRSTPLALALAGDGRIRLHVGLDERSVSFLALGLAKATGRPAVVLSTSGTGAVEFHPAVVEAAEARVPLLVCTADRPPELRHTGANQTTDQLKLYGDAVRWFCEVGVPEDRPDANAYWRATVCRAVAAAAGGPVHLNLAFREPLVDEPGAVPEGRPGGAPWTRVADRLDPAALGVPEPVRPVIVAGDTRWDASALLDLGWPVLAEPMSGLRRGPYAISTYSHLLAAPTFADAHRPDLVLRVGRIGLSKPLLRWLTPDVPQVLVDPDGAWLDPTRALQAIVRTLPDDLPTAPASWTQRWQSAEASARRVLDDLLDAEERPNEPRTARDVAAAVPEGGTLVVASSMPVRDLDRYMAPRAIRVLANRGVSGIDGFVSTALGVALTGPTVALAGDLSFLHDRNGLLLDDRGDVDLTLVVVNNDGGGIFSFLPQAEQVDPATFERLYGTPHGIDLAQVAATHGCWYERVERMSDLSVAPRGGVSIVEVRTDRQENVALHRRLDEAVASALG